MPANEIWENSQVLYIRHDRVMNPTLDQSTWGKMVSHRVTFNMKDNDTSDILSKFH